MLHASTTPPIKIHERTISQTSTRDFQPIQTATAVNMNNSATKSTMKTRHGNGLVAAIKQPVGTNLTTAAASYK